MRGRDVTFAVGLSFAGCAQTNVGPDGAAADVAPCSTPRSATVVVVTNVDGPNDYSLARREMVLDLLGRLVRGDVDGGGGADLLPLESVRLFVVPNEIRDPRFDETPSPCVTASDGRFVPSACGVGGEFQRIVRGDDSSWLAEADCRLADVPSDSRGCVPEPIEAALVALSREGGPVNLEPRRPLGDTVNAAFHNPHDVLVILLEGSDLRDDCSHRFYENAAERGICAAPDDLHCCAANLPPLPRSAEGFRALATERPVIVASIGMHPPFDPQTEPALRAREIAESDDCALARPHARMAGLAEALYPDMHLVSVRCEGLGGEAHPGLTALTRRVLQVACE